MQSGPGIGPVATRGAVVDLEGLRCLLHSQADEITEFYQFGHLVVFPIEYVQSVIQSNERIGRDTGRYIGLFQVHTPVLTALVPGGLRLYKRDGSEVRVTVSWGSLIALGQQVRIVVNDARVRHLPPLSMAG